ncbi:MAG: hypothetical protein SF162_07640 [bacterium]|nr:hypothetical protein [bacterium]
MSNKRAKALAGQIIGMAIVAAWAIGSGWLANQPTGVSILAVLVWFGVLALMVVRNIF